VFIADLQDLDRCATVIAEARAKLGPIHLLVNNAVTNEDPIKLKDLTPQYIRLMADVDLHAPLMLARAALPDLEATQGSIVNISSVAVRWNWSGSLMYGSMKAALEHATECLAAELAPQNIRVNCIRLGSVPGDMSLRHAISQLTPEQARQLVEDVMPVFERSQNMSAQPVTGRPRDVGELIVFLASPKARFLTGAVIPLDGGLVVQMEAKPHRVYMSDLVRQWTRQHAPHVKPEDPH
jgi:NAD(P)-dependent dehydrogenase (short-subunit alcohol dehydrogenase family)